MLPFATDLKKIFFYFFLLGASCVTAYTEGCADQQTPPLFDLGGLGLGVFVVILGKLLF
jgi:hypothetical protein